MIRRRVFFTLLLAVSAGLAAKAGLHPQRIVSLSPNTTELLYGVGAFPRVVAVSQYCSYPPEVAKLPRVGGWQDSNIEKIVATRPDLVVLTKAQEPFIADRLQVFGIRWIAVPSESLSDVFAAINEIGEATGNQKQASELARQTRSSLDIIHAATKSLPQTTVLLVISRTPGSLTDLYAATEGSYLADLIRIAGGRSIATPAPSGYAKMSKEAVLALNPDVIIDLVHSSESRLAENRAEVWNDLPELKAVRARHIYSVDDEFVPHPSQFVVHTAEVFEHILHPEARNEGKH